MPIEFRCTACSKLLRVADSSAGAKAKCPSCGTVLLVPRASLPAGPPQATASPGGNPFATPPIENANPYAAPAGASLAATGPIGKTPIVPSPLSIGMALTDAMQILQRDFWRSLVVSLTPIVLPFMFLFLLGGVMQLVSGPDEDGDRVGSIVVAILGSLFMLLQLWLGCGMVLFFSRSARRLPARFADLFAAGHAILPTLGATFFLALLAIILYVVALLPTILTNGLGLLLTLPLIFFGNWWMTLTYSQFLPLIVDRNLGPVDALTTSARVTRGNRLLFFVLSVVCGTIVMLGALFLVIGLLVALPLVQLTLMTAYLQMSGQRATR